MNSKRQRSTWDTNLDCVRFLIAAVGLIMILAEIFMNSSVSLGFRMNHFLDTCMSSTVSICIAIVSDKIFLLALYFVIESIV